MSGGSIFLGEFLGTGVLMLLGTGVNIATSLSRYKTVWGLGAFGWGFAVLAGGYIALPLSGAGLNPAVTIGLALRTGDWSDVPIYLAGQFLGAIVGTVFAWLAYYSQFREGNGDVLEVFATRPEIPHRLPNLATETIATFALVLLIVATSRNEGLTLSGSNILVVALVVTGLVLALGRPTGAALNPVRDLGPRIVHAMLPIPGKGGSDWGYAWVPVAGPILGGVLAGILGATAY